MLPAAFLSHVNPRLPEIRIRFSPEDYQGLRAVLIGGGRGEEAQQMVPLS